MNPVWWRFLTTIVLRTGGAGGTDAGELAKQVATLADELAALDTEFHSASPVAAMIVALMNRVLWLETDAVGAVPVSIANDDVPGIVPLAIVNDDVPPAISSPAQQDDPYTPVPYVGSALAVNQDGSIGASIALANSAASSTATLTNGPIAGNPTKWVPMDDQGTIRYLPMW